MNEATREGSADAHASDLDFLPPSTRPDSLGRVGHYEVLQMLGQGEFGIVFRAFDEQLRRVVAIKALAPQLAAATSARKRFLREGQSSAKVRHENIVQVYAVEEQPLPYLVMEFVAGETLQQRLDRIGLLEPAEVVRIGRQIAEGLAAAHASGLIHRDIKPANILIEAGPDQRVKITDFGLARAADDARLTQSGVISGTPMYMAPEQAQSEALDQRADLFSLGSVLYTMCSGQPPFRASSTLAVLKRVVEDTPRPIPEIVPDVPQWLCEIITQLHAKEPEGRIGTAREVADLLERGVTGMQHPGNAPSITQAAPALRRPRFRIGRWAATAALLLLGGLGVTEVTGVTNVRGTVIRLFSPNETRVVDVDDASSNVNIDGSAQEVSAPKKTAEQTPDTKEDGSPTSIKDPDRRAAEYVLSNRGKVQINEQDHEIEKAADLPRDAFRLTWVNMDGNLLGHTQARDAGLACFKYCKNLKYLNLDHTPLDNAGLSRLRGCKNLTYLNLGHTWVTDVGLANLKDWKALAHLNLDGNEEVTDAGLVHLKGCKNLTELFVRQTIVTAAGIDDLKKTLPKCKIEWNGGVIEPRP